MDETTQTALVGDPVPVASTAPPAATAATAYLTPEPYLHVGPHEVYNPLTDLTLSEGDSGYAELRDLAAGILLPSDLGGPGREALTGKRWLVDRRDDLDARYLLKYVSLEAHTVCNQACYFCPVAYQPRESYFMPTEQYQDILRQLSVYKDTLEGVIMISYNEPTIDPRFVEQVGMIRAAGLPPAALSNGSGLTPKKIDGLLELGGLRFLSINLSTIDRDKYKNDRGGDHLRQVLRNLDYAKDKKIAEEMDMVVLGTGDERHKSDYEEIRQRFAGSLFNVKYFEVNDRAGYLNIGLKVAGSKRKLKGCNLVGSRPLQHLHITPHGKCVLCCQDYSEHHVVGDLRHDTIHEVLTGPAMKLMRRWVYGHEDAPADFICRNCEFALVE